MRQFIQLTSIIAITLCLLTSCNKLEESGINTSRTVDLFSYNDVEMKGEFNIEFVHGSPGATIEGDQSVVDAIEFDQSGNRLKIGLDKHYHFIDIDNPITIQLSTDNIRSIKALGENRIDMIDNYDLRELALDFDGENFIQANGQVEQLDLSLLGQNTINAFDLIAQNVFIQTTGENLVEINCENLMHIELFGECEIYYMGSPRVEQQVFGSGTIVNVN